MASDNSEDVPASRAGVQFATTHWSVVLEAGHGSSTEAKAALEELCQAYWYPLYVYVRRRGYGVEDAQDLTQDFFALLLRKGHFALPNPARGKFRSFLLTALQHFLANDWNRSHAAKRGGDCSFCSWDQQEAERRYLAEPVSVLTPEQLFERRWAITLLERVLANLRKECLASGRVERFEALKDSLWGERTSVSYADLGQRWGTTEGAVKGAAHRLRHRYRELLEIEIAHTVASHEEIEQEVRDLIAAVSGQI
jgi:RNA polymerase sigma-70 factor (ECF subfamily)